MKRYLADTHAWLWFMGGESRRLGARARRAFAGLTTGRSAVAMSTISLWEVSLLHDEGKIQLRRGFLAWCDAVEAHPGIAIEPLVRADIEEARSLRGVGDPMDRLIAGTALRLGVSLITADGRLAADRRVRTVW